METTSRNLQIITFFLCKNKIILAFSAASKTVTTQVLNKHKHYVDPTDFRTPEGDSPKISSQNISSERSPCQVNDREDIAQCGSIVKLRKGIRTDLRSARPQTTSGRHNIFELGIITQRRFFNRKHCCQCLLP